MWNTTKKNLLNAIFRSIGLSCDKNKPVAHFDACSFQPEICVSQFHSQLLKNGFMQNINKCFSHEILFCFATLHSLDSASFRIVGVHFCCCCCNICIYYSVFFFGSFEKHVAILKRCCSVWKSGFISYSLHLIIITKRVSPNKHIQQQPQQRIHERKLCVFSTCKP